MIFGLFDQLFPLMFTVIFLIVIGTFIYTAVTGLTTWHKNNQSPRLTVPAKVVAKRQNTTHHSHPAAGAALLLCLSPFWGKKQVVTEAALSR